MQQLVNVHVCKCVSWYYKTLTTCQGFAQHPLYLSSFVNEDLYAVLMHLASLMAAFKRY
jgi:hypothetical protein